MATNLEDFFSRLFVAIFGQLFLEDATPGWLGILPKREGTVQLTSLY
jgi:hypothetical protein